VRAEVDRFPDVVECETGTEGVLYVGDDWEDRYPIRVDGGRQLWHRRFLRRPDVDGWLIWQITGFANVEGIDGDADLNIMRPPHRVG
jgi:lysozyme